MSTPTYDRLHDQLRRAADDLARLATEYDELDELFATALRREASVLYRWSAQAFRNRRYDPLPAGQARVLAFVQQHIKEHGFAPTRSEIADALGWQSPNAAEEHLRALVGKGVIEMAPGVARGIRVCL